MISKRTSYILRSLIALCAALLIFAGCSFRTILPSATGTIKVDVSLDDEFTWDVARQAVLQSDDRSAVPSGFPTEDSTKFVFAGAVHAEGSLDSPMLREGVCTYDTSTGIVSIELPFPIANENRTKLTIYAFAHGTEIDASTSLSSALLVGVCGVSVPANSVTATIPNNTLIKMKPNTTSAKGTVNLSIKIPKEYFLSADNSSLLLSKVAAADGDTIEYTISGNNIAAGSPNVTFSLLKTDGNKSSAVFAWSETINVLPGLTTDKWTSSSIGTISNNGKTRTISEITIASTFYVRGEAKTASGIATDSWFETFGSAEGSDTTGTGSLAKPYATLQKAVDKVLAVSNGAADESYTIFVDGKITAATTDTAPMANFSEFTSGCSVAVKGLRSTENKATLDGNNTVQGIVVGSYDGSSGPAINVNLTLENLIITKCATSEYGAGILLSGNNTTTHKISNCEISGNTATKKGCGICNYQTNLIINDTTISENTTDEFGGGIYNIYGTATFTNSTISGNTAKDHGGGIYTRGTITITNSTVSGNKANDKAGGGIFTVGNYTIGIINSTISENTATSDVGGGLFATDSSTVNISDSTFSGNTATKGGGAIYNNTGVSATISDCIISGNKVTGSSGKGNAIYHDGRALNLSGSTQIESVGSDANDVYLYSSSKKITITGTLTPPDSSKPVAIITPSSYTSGNTVLNATAGDGTNSDANKALLEANYTKFAVTPQVKADSSIVNWAVDNEGKLKLDISAVIYLSSSGNDSRNGASATTAVKTFKRACEVLSYTAATPTIILCDSYTISATDAPYFDFSGKFESGSTKKVMIQRNSGWQGKLLDTGTCTEITLKNIVIDGNNAATPSNDTDKGNTSYPLLYINSTATVTLGDNAVFQNDNDRAVHNEGKFIIDGGLITGINTAYGNYGAVKNNKETSEFTLKKGKIENTAGSAIYNKGKVKIEGGAITGNNADNGGAIYNSTNGTVEITGGTISDNNADNGGAIYISSGTVTISGGTLSGNTATVKGGAIHCKAGTTLSMSGGEISGNSVTLTADITPADGDGGGGISADNATINISGNAKISGNKVELTGIKSGASANIFRGGGGICAINNSAITISDTAEISSNTVNIDESSRSIPATAIIRGAGIAFNTGVITINDSAKLTKNIANKCKGTSRICYGGAIELYSGILNINGGEISQNKAYNGGAVNTRNEYTINMSSGLVSKNIAYNHGGAFALSRADGEAVLNLTGGTITENSIEGTAGEGEAINMTDSSTLIISGSPIIDSSSETGNNIYINANYSAGAQITISGPLTLPSGASAFARINLPPSKYTRNLVVLRADGTNLTELTNDICKMFVLNASGDSKTAHPDFCIRVSATDSKKGVVADRVFDVVASSVTMPSGYTFTLQPESGTVAKTTASSGNYEISFSVKKGGTNIGTSDGATYKMELRQNGVAVANASGADGNKLKIPAWLPAGNYQVYMCLLINGVVMDSANLPFAITN